MKRTATALAQTMKYVPIDAVMKYKARIAGKLADAVCPLRVADAKLEVAIDEYEPADHENGCLEKSDLLEARFTTKFFADMLATGDETASLPLQVFRAIAKFTNDTAANTPHIEGAILALKLAERSLTAALKLAGQDDEEGIDERYEQPYAARGTIRQFLAMLTSAAFVFDEEGALDAILAARARSPRQRNPSRPGTPGRAFFSPERINL